MSTDYFVLRYKGFSKCLHKDEYLKSYLREGSLFIFYKDTEYHNTCDVLNSFCVDDMNELRHIQRNIRMWQKTLTYETNHEYNRSV